jgi:ethanolaminephosphotransferase
MGLVCNIIMNILTIYFTKGHIDGTVPNWLCFVSAFLYFSYHILDLCDGKHARRIGQSSALGMLMDHGCDAVTCTLLSVSLGAIIKFRKITSLFRNSYGVRVALDGS